MIPAVFRGPGELEVAEFETIEIRSHEVRRGPPTTPSCEGRTDAWRQALVGSPSELANLPSGSLDPSMRLLS